MSVVTCPKCQERYDPGVDEELRDLAENTSLKVVCPKCGQWLRLPEHEPIDAPDLPADLAAEMRSQSRPIRNDASSEKAWGEAEDRPRRRRRHLERDERRDHDDRYRPWVDQASEDYNDNPSGRSRPMDGLGLAAMIVGIASCVVTLVGFCCPFVDVLSVAGGITAVILGYMARRRPTKSGMAIAGIVTGFASTGLSTVWLIVQTIQLILILNR